MKKKDRQYVADRVESEGFDYTFARYDTFGEVEDEKFHTLRKTFVNARAALIEYAELEDCECISLGI